MKLCIYLVVINVYIYIHAQPLPSANPGLVRRFQSVLDAILSTGIGMLARSTTREDALSENIIISPLSATVLTAELMLGKSKNLLPSESDLYQELTELLQLLEGAPNATKHFELKRQDAVFVNKKITLSRVYIKNLRDFFETHVHYLDFEEDAAGAQREINSWVSRNTNGHIRSTLPSPPPSLTSSILASTTSLQAKWQTSFTYALNRSQFFNVNSTKKIPVTYLTHQFDQIVYGESSDYQLISLPYTKGEVGMYIILPKHNSRYKYDMKSFISRISFEDVQETISNAERRDVFVKIPKVSLSRSFSVREDLMANVGLKQRNIDLEGAVVSGSLRVDDVMQQVVVDFDEMDIEFSDVGTIGANLVGGVKYFVVDRPFLFFVRHEATSVLLFIGAVTDPMA